MRVRTNEILGNEIVTSQEYRDNPIVGLNEDVSFVVSMMNPVTDNLIIKTNSIFSGYYAKIFSVLGQEVGSVELNEQQNNINLSHLRKGIYLVKIETENGIKTFKIIKN
jgi:hypothetical protein